MRQYSTNPTRRDQTMNPKTNLDAALCGLLTLVSGNAANGKPNLLVARFDDIGVWNISSIGRGRTGCQTPNIDRIASEGVAFTDGYGPLGHCRRGHRPLFTHNP